MSDFLQNAVKAVKQVTKPLDAVNGNDSEFKENVIPSQYLPVTANKDDSEKVDIIVSQSVNSVKSLNEKEKVEVKVAEVIDRMSQIAVPELEEFDIDDLPF